MTPKKRNFGYVYDPNKGKGSVQATEDITPDFDSEEDKLDKQIDLILAKKGKTKAERNTKYLEYIRKNSNRT